MLVFPYIKKLGEVLYWKDTKKLWDKNVQSIAGADWFVWTPLALSEGDAESLLQILNDNKEKDLILAVYFLAAHYNREYAKIDNFNVNIFTLE